MSMLVAWALGYAGFAALCLAMDKHHRAIVGHPPRRGAVPSLRVAGFALLAAALVQCIAASSVATGLVAWFAVLTAAAVPLAFALPYAPRMVVGLAAAALPLAALLLLARA